MEGYAYYNGKIGKCRDISIPLTDRLIYFGDGIYEVMIGRSNMLFLPEDHIDRLFFGINELNIYCAFSKDDLISLIYRLINISGYESYMIYISVSRDADERTHSYIDCTSANLLIIIKEFSLSKSDGLKLITLNDDRYNYCHIKTVNLLPSVIAATKAQIAGCDEAVFIRGGIVTECAHSNIFIIKNETLITHPISSSILPGVTRKHLIKIAKDLKIPVIESGFTKSELMTSDEVIVTSTTKFANEAKIIDGHFVGGKNKRLLEELKRHILDLYQKI